MPSASERLLRSVLDSIQELAVLADSQGRIREFNRACEALTGYGREEVLGKELVPTFVPDRWIEAVGSRFVDPSAPDAREPHEYAWRTRSGEERPIRWRCTPVAIPGEASPWTLGLGRDAAEERKLDSTLRSRARLLERFFDSALSCAVILDPQFNFLRVNTAYADACGRSVADFPGPNLFEMYPTDAKGIFEEVVRSRKPHSIQGRTI
ncbi:MAG: PAS domain S-box protein [Candidatus Eisenbacteria bacterium]|nr:PAS domain S-box protein [Candidatus Eisenbacteria bacterium]